MKTYERLYGNVSIPHKFIVPKNEDWPEETWKMKLGSVGDNIRSRNYHNKINENKRIITIVTFAEFTSNFMVISRYL